tara:strand:+ start:360 stop:524 length:165 start_codon:yes stop_codon:yes gene_type:complete
MMAVIHMVIQDMLVLVEVVLVVLEHHQQLQLVMLVVLVVLESNFQLLSDNLVIL